MDIADKVVALHLGLEAAGLAHAFGGALALAYCTDDPRGTKDIDVNVFLDADRVDELLPALPTEVPVSDEAKAAIRRDGQTRLWWDRTPVDVFLTNDPFHDHVAASIRRVPFPPVDELPVLACPDLAVFKAFFARPKDAIDVAAMITAGAIDRARLQRSVEALLGEGERDRFFARVDDALDG